MASIQKRPNGSWRARYHDDTGKERSRHFTRKADAQRFLNQVTTRLTTGTYVSDLAGRQTFREFYAEWSPRQLWKDSTRDNARLTVDSASFADVELRLIRRSHLEAWVKEMASRLAPTTIKTRVVIARSVFRAAMHDKLIAHDPTEGLVLPRPRRQAAAMRIPTPAEVGKLIDAAGDDFVVFIALCALAGLRQGEAAGLQVQDIDFLRRRLTISRQVQRDRGRTDVREPKWGSERVIPIPDDLVTMLSELVARRGITDSPEAWLFIDGDEPLKNNAVAYRWRQARKRADLEHVRMHDLRHFYASGLIAQGCDVVSVQRNLGHSSATTTLNTYSHLWQDSDDRTRSAASAMVREILAADSSRTDEAL